MIYDKLTYRFLDLSDKDEYVRLCKSFNKTMGVNVNEITSTHMDTLLDTFDSADSKHVGGFTDQGQLVAALSGYFTQAPYWYCHSQFSAIDNSSLFGAVDILAANFQLHNLLLREGEKNSYYSCFTRKTVRSQYTHELTRERISAKNIYKT
jgi:hypothetical protein